ncbi:hypothetical protein [Pararobbsia alpina]|uniref:Uncharacterized protein n=1 Tax=Pararobbsia alpina TaxID=621374 RepID=A0A6S7C0Y1_9BURK|nr:hypothetical protein [Pararobbsia alpina]CAB3798816.1 hypothetical protein LMG28138_04531 [Pararobbsia alpina]
MIAVKKLSLGFRPENKAFRTDSLRGTLIDALLDARGSTIPDTFYAGILDPSPPSVISMANQEEGNVLYIDRDNVVFTKDTYKNNGHVDLDKTFGEFRKVWNVIQKVLNLRNIRRIGMLAELRFEAAKNNNLELLSLLSKIPARENTAHFVLQYEHRSPPSNAPLDILKGAFTNTIYQFYDSAVDAASPAEGKINANIDFQRYYSPTLNDRVFEEAQKHLFQFKKELTKFDSEITALGIKK